MKCDRCGKISHALEECMNCKKMACNSCVKSGKRETKVKKLYLCKTCWGNIPARTAFKSA